MRIVKLVALLIWCCFIGTVFALNDTSSQNQAKQVLMQLKYHLETTFSAMVA